MSPSPPIRPHPAAIEVNSAPELGVRNSQPEGVGRVAAAAGLVCWNNLGRNVVFADRGFRPKAVFATTLFPGEDEPSQYDLDVHAILDLPELGMVTFLNHLGVVRGFRSSDVTSRAAGLRHMEPVWLGWFAADVERTIAAGGRLIGSAPRSEGACGLLVSAPLRAVADRGKIPIQAAASWFGEVTGLGVAGTWDRPLIALGGPGRVALAPLVADEEVSPRWNAEVGFRVAAIGRLAGAVWAAGPELGEIDDYNWEGLTGGGFAILDGVTGELLQSGPLPADAAWGTGGVAVAPVGMRLAVAGRTGCVHLIDLRHPASPLSTLPIAAASLGIAHMAVVGPLIVCGFNRGGYRLHVLNGEAAATQSRTA